MSKKGHVLTLPGPFSLHACRKKGQEHLVILTLISYRLKLNGFHYDQVQNVPDFIIEKRSEDLILHSDEEGIHKSD